MSSRYCETSRKAKEYLIGSELVELTKETNNNYNYKLYLLF